MMIYRSVLLLFIITLIGCGGSGGDGNNKSSSSKSNVSTSSTLSTSSQSSSAASSVAGMSSSSEFSSNSYQSSSGDNTSSAASTASIYGTVYHQHAATTMALRVACNDGYNASAMVSAGSFGSYSINVKESSFPCFLQAKFDSSPFVLHSYAFEDGIANITALTDLTVALYLSVLPETAFSNATKNICGAVCAPDRGQLNQAEKLIRQAIGKKLYKYEPSFFTSKIIDGDNKTQTLSELLQSIQLSPDLSDYSSLLVLVKDGNLSNFPENVYAQNNSSSSSSSSQSSSSISSNASSVAPTPYYEAGKHYKVLDQPVQTSDPSKIEVVEVFSYHSVHCFNFEPMLQAWKKQQADDVVIVQNHAVWNAPMEISAQAFYTAKVLKIDDTTHAAIFNAIHLEREILSSAEQWVDFLSSFGVERETLAKTFDSLDVKSRVSQASARARSYGITGAPEMVVNGKYRISTREAGSNTEMLKIVDFLVGRERNSASTDERSAAISNSKYMLSEDAKWYQ